MAVGFYGADGDTGFEDDLFEGLVLLVEGLEVRGAMGDVAVWLDYPDVNIIKDKLIINYCGVSVAGDLFDFGN